MSATFSYVARVREQNHDIVANRLATGDFMGAPSYRAIHSNRGVRGVKRGVRGRGENVRQMFMKVGDIGSYNVELLMPQAFLMPRTTDPDAQATILTVEGLQRAINKVSAPGGGVEVNGLLTPDTVQAFRKVAGPYWMSKTWVQIYGDFSEMITRGMKITSTGIKTASAFENNPVATGDYLTVATGDYVSVGDSFTTVPTAVLMGGLALLVLAFK